MRAWRSIDTLKAVDDGRLCAWLDVIARNTVIDARRARQLMLVPLDDGSADPADPADLETDVESKLALDRALTEINALPAALRVPFLLSVIEGRTAAEIGAELGITAVTVRQRITRARRSIAHLAVDQRLG